MKTETLNIFLAGVVLLIFLIIGWAIWHHFEDEHQPGFHMYPDGRMEYNPNYNHNQQYSDQWYRDNGYVWDYRRQRWVGRHEDYWRQGFDPTYPEAGYYGSNSVQRH